MLIMLQQLSSHISKNSMFSLNGIGKILEYLSPYAHFIIILSSVGPKMVYSPNQSLLDLLKHTLKPILETMGFQTVFALQYIPT
jgi:Fe2+ transport system protein B